MKRPGQEGRDSEREGPRESRCYRRIGSQLGTYIHAPPNNSEAMISKLQITRRPTTKPTMEALFFPRGSPFAR